MGERMKAISVFTGIAGGDLGMEAAGIETVAQIENAKFPVRVLAKHYQEVPRFGDVTKVDPRDLPTVDVLHGGFPCQDVSVAGRRAGLAGERSSLFHEFSRLADALRPEWVVIENVPGLRSSNGGSDMGAVVGKLAELGYLGAYRSFDAQYLGLAQRRERVFFVGHLGDGARAVEVLFEPDCGSGNPPQGREAGTDVAHALTGHAAKGGDPSTDNHVASLSGLGDGGPDDNDAQAHRLFMVQDARDLSDKAQNGWGITEADGPMYTLDGTSEHAVATWDPKQVTSKQNRTGFDYGTPAGTLHEDGLSIAGPRFGVRKLTPLEEERLQGFPDGWTCLCGAVDALREDAGVPYEVWRASDWRTARFDSLTALCTCKDSPRYKALGNAIARPVMAWIAQRIQVSA